MYFPQTYHHIQEIQKYNIQDYRPRYVPPIPLFHRLSSPHTYSSLSLSPSSSTSTNFSVIQDGAIPKSHPQSTTSHAHAETARLRLQPSRRVADTRAAGIRHNQGARTIRRDGQFAEDWRWGWGYSGRRCGLAWKEPHLKGKVCESLGEEGEVTPRGQRPRGSNREE